MMRKQTGSFYNRVLFTLALFCAAACVRGVAAQSAAAQPAATGAPAVQTERPRSDSVMRKKLVMNVDFFDELDLHGESMGPENVEELVKQCKLAGVDRMCWRALGLGIPGYPSKLVKGVKWVTTADLSLSVARMSAAEREAYAKRRAAGGSEYWEGRLTATLARMDPIATARDACRRHGIEFYIWLDLIDERMGSFLLGHPECLVLGRDGKTPWPGLRSYANAAAVENQLAVIDELAAYRPDGLYLSTSCHTRHLNFPEPDDFFGFEAPVAEAYRRETGRDLFAIATAEEYAIWHRIKGDFFTEFLRRAKQRMKPLNVRLMVGTQFGRYTNLTSPYFDGPVKYRFETQWKRWVDEGIADALVLGDYEWPWDRVPTWGPKGIKPPEGKQVADLCSPEYVQYIGGRAETFLFSSWLSAYAQHHKGASADNLEEAMRMRSRTLQETGVGGICLHEAWTFEKYKGFDTIHEMRKTLDAVRP